MDDGDSPPSGAAGLFTPPISIVLSSSRGACSRSHCRCDGFLPNYWDGHYCRNCLHLATFHDPNSTSEPSGGAPQPSTWHSFPKSWDKSRFLASLGVAPLSDAKGTAIPRGRSDNQPPRRAGGRGANPGAAATAAAADGDDVSDSDSDGQPVGRAYGRGPLWKSDGSRPIGVERRHPAGDDDEASLNQTVFITPIAAQSSAAAIEAAAAAAKAAEAQAEVEAKEMTALMEIVTALCVQQKENEASLEEVTVVMGELERKWRAEQRENEKERRQARRHYEDNMKKRDAEIMRMREELKRERCLREMAEDRVKRADDAAKAGERRQLLPPPAGASQSSSSGLDRRGAVKKEGGEGGDDGEDDDGDDDRADDWTTAKTFEKRPANFFLPAPVAVLSGGSGGGGRDSPTRHPDSPGRVDELDSDTAAKNEDGGAVPAAKNESEARRNDEGASAEGKTAAASKRDEVLEQMAAIYWKERREHRVTKEALERDIREQRARIEKLEQENEKLIDKIQEIELRELAVLEKEKRMSLTPEEGERRKLEYLFEKLLNVGNMVSEITHEIQLIKK
ncbi:uncharacterized protein ACA1_202760 [Acanthamoeba castellanii str. Neff]|uniref:Uncharacterized protein n=1 Tax=Acanthamoeba castellanii (strain ATCC 30010 / Neff) TaxID=1257118 RepID=L8GUI7_ACACF|nr:uncharacterized protein ACA1_202760 [Acanthamoeba castellanii str. Neff]ELR16293.1 hypothetical protein ACA1_202760 [Acanthamoeba castellanii str. Neff]